MSTVRLAACHGHFSYNRPPVRACGDRASHKISASRKRDYRGPLSRARFELYRLFSFYPEPWRCGLAANVADANVRLGHGRCDRGDVDGQPAMVRGGILLGHRRHVASSSHAKPALWLSGLAVHQFFHIAFSHYRQRGFPDVDPPVPATSDVDRARVVVVGVLFFGYADCRCADWL